MEPEAQAKRVVLEKRSARRGATDANVRVRKLNQSASLAQLNDISTTGCSIAFAGRLDTGAALWITLPGLDSIPGRVTWNREFQAGIQFDQPLHPAIAGRFAPGVDQRSEFKIRRRREPLAAGGQPLERPVPRAEPRFVDIADPSATQLTVNKARAALIDISSSGLRVKLYERLSAQIGETVRVKLGSLPPYEGELVWMREDEAGIAFPEAVIDLIEAEPDAG